jgi:putative ABC transport system permease protein
MVLAIAVSSWQRLGLERTLAMATGRTVVQLGAVGYLLAIVFAWKQPGVVLIVLAAMSGIAARVAQSRIGKNIPHLLLLIWGSILVGTTLTLSYVNLVVLQPDVWYDPQYLIPLAGIVLGNAMNASAIAGERFVSLVKAGQLDIETHLCLGATPRQAVETYRKEAIKAGLIPTLNSMMVVGVVTLPGIITGQMLGGVNPFEASLYQMLIMFMLAFATLVTTVLVTRGLCRQCFNPAAQLTWR